MHVAWQAQYKRHVDQRCSEARELTPEKGCILERQIVRFAKMISRDRCSTLSDLASLLRGKRNTLDKCSGKIAERIVTRTSALH